MLSKQSQLFYPFGSLRCSLWQRCLADRCKLIAPVFFDWTEPLTLYVQTIAGKVFSGLESFAQSKTNRGAAESP